MYEYMCGPIHICPDRCKVCRYWQNQRTSLEIQWRNSGRWLSVHKSFNKESFFVCFESRLAPFSGILSRICSFWQIVVRHWSFEVLKVFFEPFRIKPIWTWYATWWIKNVKLFYISEFQSNKNVLLSIKYNIFTQERPDNGDL